MSEIKKKMKEVEVQKLEIEANLAKKYSGDELMELEKNLKDILSMVIC